jgi:type I restriction enzyme, R subunit
LLNEADTRAKLLDPAIHARGWTEDLIKREQSARPIEILAGRARRYGHGRVDYLLCVRVLGPASVPLALIEAKDESKHPGFGLDQGKQYAAAGRLSVPFVFSSNGHLFVEFDATTGLTTAARPLAEFPTPEDLLGRWQAATGVDLAAAVSRPLGVPYKRGGFEPRYYQDAAIRAALEAIALGRNRLLLSLATGSGKTLIAAHILRRIADAGQMRRALFICDRDELRTQGIDALQKVFGAEVASITTQDVAKNARVAVTTYQSLDMATDDEGTSLLLANFPIDHFSHIVIDECHRSAWGKWKEILEHNPNAIQIGLTATPRRVIGLELTPEMKADLEISADNIEYFGEPIYEYSMAQGMDDGYLAACEIVKSDIYLDRAPNSERVVGVSRDDLAGKKIRDARTGEALDSTAARDHYSATTFEDDILLPERVQGMAEDFFKHLLVTGGPEQKTIIFCARDRHAEDVAVALDNLYVEWCQAEGRKPAVPYAFRCTADNDGRTKIADFKGSRRHHWIATTVELLTTGVDVPSVQNIAFFRYVRGPMAFTQMVGRGTRIDDATDKLMFRVYDYTNATRLFGGDFLSRATPDHDKPPVDEPEAPEPTIEVLGFTVRVSDAGKAVLRNVAGKAVPVAMEEYEREVAERIRERIATLDDLRRAWISPTDRRALLASLPEGEASVRLIQALAGLDDCDLYDVVAQVTFDSVPRTRAHRAYEFTQNNVDWLGAMSTAASGAVRALVDQFARSGTEGLERKEVFETTEVAKAGGIRALAEAGDPRVVLSDTKERVLA